MPVLRVFHTELRCLIVRIEESLRPDNIELDEAKASVAALKESQRVESI